MIVEGVIWNVMYLSNEGEEQTVEFSSLIFLPSILLETHIILSYYSKKKKKKKI